jgi:drug/metabolite transporter (DMT)-like permease
MALSAVLVLPAAVATPPTEAPTLRSLGATLLLGIGGSGIAFLLFYVLNAEVGPARASVIAYLGPAFSVTYGALLLDEAVTAGTLVGLGLILVGSYLATSGLPARLTARGALRP